MKEENEKASQKIGDWISHAAVYRFFHFGELQRELRRKFLYIIQTFYYSCFYFLHFW